MNSLANQRVLVVEDEFLISAMLCEMLTDAQALVVGPVTTVAAGMQLLQEADFDCAILDMNLNGEWSDAIAEELGRRNIPFIFTTGYGSIERSERLGGHTVSKPYLWEEVEKQLLRAISDRAGQKAM
jgi:DNA-binding NtrC family response regulator